MNNSQIAEWQTAVIAAGLGARATRVGMAYALKCDTGVTDVYLTEAVALEEFGIARTALYTGRRDLAAAGFLRPSRWNAYGGQTWALTFPQAGEDQ